RRRMAAVAVTGGRVALVEGRRARVGPGGGSARLHAHVRRSFVATLAAAHPRRGDRVVTGDVERRARGIAGAACADLEAAGRKNGRRVTAGTAAVGGADRNVVSARPTDDRDRIARRWAGKRSGTRSMALRTGGDSLVHTGHRVHREVAGCRVALRTYRCGRDV